MPRYHVDTDYDGCTVRDLHGLTLDDDATAQTHARMILANLARSHKADDDARALRVLLRDGNGKVFYGATVWLRGNAMRTVVRS